MRITWNLKTVFLVVLVGAALGGCGTSIRAGSRGIEYWSLREPALQKKVNREGFYFLWPWNSLVVYDVTWQSRSEEVAILTSDDLHVSTRVTVTFRPVVSQLRRVALELGQKYYARVIRPPFLTLARSEFAKHKHNQLAKHSPALEADVLARLRTALKGKPLEIDRVSIDHIQYDRRVTNAISKKLSMEQRAEQKQFELVIAKRDAQIARERARGVGDAIRIQAEGEARAIVLKGKAQATAQDAIAKTLTPRYLQYKAFDGSKTRYYFVPTKKGMPLIINADPPGVR